MNCRPLTGGRRLGGVVELWRGLDERRNDELVPRGLLRRLTEALATMRRGGNWVFAGYSCEVSDLTAGSSRQANSRATLMQGNP